MECILFATLLLFVLLQRHSFVHGRTVLPIVNDFLVGNNNVSSIHCDVFRLDANLLGIDRATDGIAELDHPGIFGDGRIDELRNQDAVVSRRLDVKQGLGIFH